MTAVALITGGAHGIGRAIVEDLSADHEIALTWHTSQPDAVLAKLPRALAIKADLARSGAAERIIDAVIARFGRLDVIVNNAGSLLSDADDAGQNFAVNVAAPMALLSAALPHLKAGASVINMSSVNAALPAMGAVSYSDSKVALDTWTRGMGKTLGPKGIRVNGVAPGAIERRESPRPAELVEKFVEMTALGRVGVPDDVAKVVRFLASDAAGFITGETISVSGGYRL